MITISTLQSQIALNRAVLGKLEDDISYEKYEIKNVDFKSFYSPAHKQQFIQQANVRIKYWKKQIKQYAKLQQALKSELAHRIMYNREMRYNEMHDYQLK